MSLDALSCVPDQTASRILVADDQADVLVALRLLLRSAGLEIDTASSVQEVRTRLDTSTYDLLLMDLNYRRDTTSGREGLELLAEVHARDPLLPVVVMTGWGTIDTAVEAMRRGACSFVTKPWDNAVLADAICREVQDGRAARHAERRALREQEDAQSLQRALLPARLPVVPGGEIAARWQPAAAFGGDCYDVIRLDETRLAISIADVCGKGMAAALLMANLQAWARAFAATDGSPRSVAARINGALAGNTGLRRFVTFFYAVYDTASGRLTFTNAGHNPPFVLGAAGDVARLSAGGMVLGAFEHAAYDEDVVVLRPGDRLVLFTDGITEAARGGDDEFGDARLEVALRQAPQDRGAAALVDAIFGEVARFTDAPLQDDATVLALTLAAAPVLPRRADPRPHEAAACALANKDVP